MNPSEYQSAVAKTESEPTQDMRARLLPYTSIRLLHAGMGCATESGEFMDSLKKHIFYGSELNHTNLVEELGDILWYVATAANAMNVRLEDVMTVNIAKLEKRYGEKFSKESAEDRDLSLEESTMLLSLLAVALDKIKQRGYEAVYHFSTGDYHTIPIQIESVTLREISNKNE